jgi:SAM-dependent methyltransferase
MAHPQQAEFFGSVRQRYPASFDQVRVLEVGSLDINGSVRELFSGCVYTGVDLQPGPGVDLACPGHLLELPTASFDTVISAECFEHNPFWRETFANMMRLCRPGGLVLVSCASTGRKEHGTTRTNPDASPFTVQARWDYYRNLTPRLLTQGIHLDGWVSHWGCWVNHISRDLYFVGLRGTDGRKLDADLVRTLDARYAMTATPKALRRGLKTRLLGDLLSRP